MDLFTKYNSRLIYSRFRNWSVLAQRIHMKLCSLIKIERTFETVHGYKMRAKIHDYIPKRIFHFGIWEPNLTQFMKRTIRPGDVVVDAGANIGYFTLLMARLVKETGVVLSIEPSPMNLSALTENISVNRFKNVLVRSVAVADRTGEIKLFDSKFGARNTGTVTTIQHAPSAAANFTLVKCDTFMNIIGTLAPRISFIKIDVEGAEVSILREILLNKQRFAKPLVVVCEIFDENMNVIDEFRREGFECFFIENDSSIEGYMRWASGEGVQPTGPQKFNDRSQRPSATDLIFTYGRTDLD